MGGEITWKCLGNQYQFELVFYRDCTGAEINVLSENIRLWNHPSISTIQVLFVSREDLSPTCTIVPGSPSALTCGTGANGGNGLGAVEKIIYRSAPITLLGTPTSGTGWSFTYDNFSRNSSITNLQSPDNYGMNISATMYPHFGFIGGVCRDNSPRFLQDPYFVSCAGEAYSYSLHPVDVDLDSLSLSFSQPLNNLPNTATSFNPPISPAAIPFETGFSAGNPTPDVSFNAGNQNATLDNSSGQLNFLSNTPGNYVVKVVLESFRNGIKIAQVEREMQLIVNNCTGTNTAPDIIGPFAGSFTTSVVAGALVNFTLQSTDIEFLQDGTPQINALTTSGLQYGTNFTSNAGCGNSPCAFLNANPAIVGNQGASVDFTWQTACNHLVDANGNVAATVPYHFVFKVKDDYCQIPKYTYKTVTINVLNPGIISPVQFTCITSLANGDVQISWNPANNVSGTFVEYRLHSVTGGLIATLPFGTTNFTVPNPANDLSFFIETVSGCNGNTVLSSDTLSNVFLTVFNPATGIAQLSWNLPANQIPSNYLDQCIVQREYPAGTWTDIATLPYLSTLFKDTIDICLSLLNYRVKYTFGTCNQFSNVDGDIFQDLITPDIPVISSASIDIATGNVSLNWDVNGQSDTQAYIIYIEDQFGNIVPLDTVFGLNTTNYSYSPTGNGPFTYSLAAYDFCNTTSVPPTFQTSAKADLHTTMFVSSKSNPCSGEVDFTWTSYLGWGTNFDSYTLFIQENLGTWVNAGVSTAPNFSLPLIVTSSYCAYIEAKSLDGTTATSNKICFTVDGPKNPDIHYLRVASVSGNTIELRHHISSGGNVKQIRLERFNDDGNTFEEIVLLDATSDQLSFVDTEANPNIKSYAYRAVVIDSCGKVGSISNTARTIFLTIETDQTRLINQLDWSQYSVFAGGVFQYNVVRFVDNTATQIASLASSELSYSDDVSNLGATSGGFCYTVFAQEGDNPYGYREISYSNQVCEAIKPLVYIPNAITPNGLNPVFLPIVFFQDINKYKLHIINRWGQEIFETEDPTKGWDAKQDNNELVPLGVYMYVLELSNGQNQEYIYRGTVTVIRSVN